MNERAKLKIFVTTIYWIKSLSWIAVIYILIGEDSISSIAEITIFDQEDGPISWAILAIVGLTFALAILLTSGARSSNTIAVVCTTMSLIAAVISILFLAVSELVFYCFGTMLVMYYFKDTLMGPNNRLENRRG